MSARPIRFSGPMVRALLDGRKSQTRRIAKLTAGGHVKEPSGNRRWHPRDPDAVLACPYGQPGDLLWVQEAWNVTHRADLAPGETIERTASQCRDANSGFACACADGVVYAATGAQKHPTHGAAIWRQSNHMPRWASRLTLRITRVRLERLCGITDADAWAEGYSSASAFLAGDWADPFADRNPYVWVLEFESIATNVNAVMRAQEPA